jgi:hypothetical protein
MTEKESEYIVERVDGSPYNGYVIQNGFHLSFDFDASKHDGWLYMVKNIESLPDNFCIRPHDLGYKVESPAKGTDLEITRDGSHCLFFISHTHRVVFNPTVKWLKDFYNQASNRFAALDEMKDAFYAFNARGLMESVKSGKFHLTKDGDLNFTTSQDKEREKYNTKVLNMGVYRLAFILANRDNVHSLLEEYVQEEDDYKSWAKLFQKEDTMKEQSIQDEIVLFNDIKIDTTKIYVDADDQDFAYAYFPYLKYWDSVDLDSVKDRKAILFRMNSENDNLDASSMLDFLHLSQQVSEVAKVFSLDDVSLDTKTYRFLLPYYELETAMLRDLKITLGEDVDGSCDIVSQNNHAFSGDLVDCFEASEGFYTKEDYFDIYELKNQIRERFNKLRSKQMQCERKSLDDYHNEGDILLTQQLISPGCTYAVIEKADNRLRLFKLEENTFDLESETIVNSNHDVLLDKLETCENLQVFKLNQNQSIINIVNHFNSYSIRYKAFHKMMSEENQITSLPPIRDILLTQQLISPGCTYAVIEKEDNRLRLFKLEENTFDLESETIVNGNHDVLLDKLETCENLQVFKLNQNQSIINIVNHFNSYSIRYKAFHKMMSEENQITSLPPIRDNHTVYYICEEGLNPNGFSTIRYHDGSHKLRLVHSSYEDAFDLFLHDFKRGLKPVRISYEHGEKCIQMIDDVNADFHAEADRLRKALDVFLDHPKFTSVMDKSNYQDDFWAVSKIYKSLEDDIYSVSIIRDISKNEDMVKFYKVQFTGDVFNMLLACYDYSKGKNIVFVKDDLDKAVFPVSDLEVSEEQEVADFISECHKKAVKSEDIKEMKHPRLYVSMRQDTTDPKRIEYTIMDLKEYGSVRKEYRYIGDLSELKKRLDVNHPVAHILPEDNFEHMIERRAYAISQDKAWLSRCNTIRHELFKRFPYLKYNKNTHVKVSDYGLIFCSVDGEYEFSIKMGKDDNAEFVPFSELRDIAKRAHAMRTLNSVMHIFINALDKKYNWQDSCSSIEKKIRK